MINKKGVDEVIDILRMGQSRISRHLRILAEAGLVTRRREGTWIYYSQRAPKGALARRLRSYLEAEARDTEVLTRELHRLLTEIEGLAPEGAEGEDSEGGEARES